MRVIAGIYKGKPLKSPSSENIRPTGDKVKQAIFTKLQFFVQDKMVLDLFCGSGALGIEAISRNAKQVVFVDSDIRSVKLTKENLKIINSTAKVIHSDYKLALRNFNTKFDLILIDPPYSSGVYESCLELIHKYDLLSKDGIIVCERDKEKTFETNLFDMFDSKVYGTVAVDYYCHFE
ncbi:MAG: 16S rRNA (guanine(966)-N(2))-methyltransferase RsmD [Clostridia bacterium]|nr:16S rRNA (guanine(966)-N(2))-methyltransferase RsmD [Clostridia bacterium]